MSYDTARRMTAYTGMAAAAVAGGACTSELQADLMIFDVGHAMIPSFSPESSVYLATYSFQMNIAGRSVGVGFKVAQDRSDMSSSMAKRFDTWKVGGTSKGSDLMLAKSKSTKGGPSLLANFEGIGQVGESFEGSVFPFAKGGFRLVDPSEDKSGFSYGQFDGRFYVGFGFNGTDPLQGESPDFYAGWIELTLGQDGDFMSLTIERWAYESTPGQAASIPGGTPVPGAGGLLALALGAAGIRRRRERVA